MKNEFSTVTRKELDQFKSLAFDEKADRQKKEFLKKEELIDKSKVRIDRMKKLDNQKAVEGKKEKEENVYLSKAEDAKLEDIDEVKIMNAMVNKAFAISCLDKQIMEKNKRAEELRKEDYAKDLEMELERLKQQKSTLVEEEKLKVKRLQQRQVIIEQIKKNEEIRLKQKEVVEKEGAFMKKQ